jgi:hypothetical protein
MVGIAGEDDLDAQVGAQEVPSRGRAADTGLTRCSIPEPAPARPSELPASPSAAAPLAREKLSIEDSAATRAQLIGEIQTLPAEGTESEEPSVSGRCQTGRRSLHGKNGPPGGIA